MPYTSELPNEEYIPLLLKELGPHWVYVENQRKLVGSSGLIFEVSNTLKLIDPDLRFHLAMRFNWAQLDPSLFEFGYYMQESQLADDIRLTEKAVQNKARYEILADLFGLVPKLKQHFRWRLDPFRFSLVSSGVFLTGPLGEVNGLKVAVDDQSLIVGEYKFSLASPTSISMASEILKEFDKAVIPESRSRSR